MSLIVKERKSLEFGWHPGCKRVVGIGHKFIHGPMGKLHWDNDKAYSKNIEERKNPKIPNCMHFSINFTGNLDNAEKLYDQILSELKKDEQIQITNHRVPIGIYKYGEILKKYEIQASAIISSNNKLSKEGCDLDVFGRCKRCEKCTKSQEIPDEYREKTLTQVIGCISFAFDHSSKLYEELLKSGILEEAFPKWYKEGDY